MVESSVMDCKIPKINIRNDSVKKVKKKMHEQMGNFSKEIKTIKRVKWEY